MIPIFSLAQATPPNAVQTPVSTIVVSAREVLLDVLVTDNSGHPVTGLTAADFSVTEEGATQAVRSLQEHHPMPEGMVNRLVATPPLPPNTFTNYMPVVNTNASTVILLDALDSPMEAQMSLHEQVIGYLKHMEPGASIAIFQLDTEMRLIQGFSSDQKTLLEAARSKRDMPSLLKPINGNYDQYRRARMEILRSGMQMMGRYLSGYPGRKNLIWFTGQVPMSVFGMGLGNPFRDSLDVTPNGDDLTDLTESLRLSRVAVYPVDTRGLQPAPEMAVMSNGRMPMRTMHVVNRQVANVANLERVAEMTGGKAYYNTNGMEQVIGEVVHNGSNYYTLAYATTNQEWHGQFRKIKVEVNRPGVHLQYRDGYHAYDPGQREAQKIDALKRETAARAAAGEKEDLEAEGASSSAPGAQPDAPASASDKDETVVHHAAKGGFDSAMALGAIAPTEIVFQASVNSGTQPEQLARGSVQPKTNFLKSEWQHKPFRTYAVAIHADARPLRLTRTAEGILHGSVDFVAVVYQQTGEQVNSISITASFDLTLGQYRTLLAKGLDQKLEIAVPVKGNFFLRLGVHDMVGDQVGALEIPVDQVKLNQPASGL